MLRVITIVEESENNLNILTNNKQKYFKISAIHKTKKVRLDGRW